ncbi:hypothetical protein DLAC_04582 [Tieghemostelium lacteum]|uniref:Uncharacterized protein n=1 Tax=Tieghemostelium lacteum TaxID=361077 RepID=A0A151ZJV7_TIELA|nr:hypothetical protein DLAC_04582 [Tieghemostelium lacteum]|eukprot:KYQ94282.1 hypothetical protein DLAC_04582 [Tieghemostelium lacteum]
MIRICKRTFSNVINFIENSENKSLGLYRLNRLKDVEVPRIGCTLKRYDRDLINPTKQILLIGNEDDKESYFQLMKDLQLSKLAFDVNLWVQSKGDTSTFFSKNYNWVLDNIPKVPAIVSLEEMSSNDLVEYLKSNSFPSIPLSILVSPSSKINDLKSHHNIIVMGTDQQHVYKKMINFKSMNNTSIQPLLLSLLKSNLFD